MSNPNNNITEVISAALLDEKSVWDILLVESNGETRLIEQGIKIDNPFSLDVGSFIPRQQVCSLERFFDIAELLINYKQELEGVVQDKRIQLVSDFAPEHFHEFGEEVITWRVMSRAPSNMNRDATSTPQRKSLHSHNLRFANYPNKVITVETRPTDNEIEFSCWSKNANLANKRALWLEDLFISHDWVFLTQGADRFWFKNRGADLFTIPAGQRMHQRPLRFITRLTEFSIRAYPVINNIQLNVGEF